MSPRNPTDNPHCITCRYNQKTDNDIRVREKPEASNHMTPSWCFSQMDINHPRWNPYRMNHERIVCVFRDLEGQTWQQLLDAPKSHGTGNKNHPVDVAKLSKCAQQRLAEIGKDDLDQLFSIRLDGKKRIYGIRQERSLIVLWYDAKHEIYPVD